MIYQTHLSPLAVTLQINPRRKHIALQLERQAIVVKSPRRLSERHIRQLLDENQLWLHKQLRNRKNVNHQLDKDTLYYLGSSYTPTMTTEAHPNVQCCTDTLRLFISKNKSIDANSQLCLWLQAQAKSILPSQLRYWSKSTSLMPSGLTIKAYKARWGSCDRRGHISLNWRLIGAPIEVIDYVIIHELCHLKEMNHSAAFWQLVERCYPDFKIHRLWLKRHGHRLIQQLAPSNSQ